MGQLIGNVSDNASIIGTVDTTGLTGSKVKQGITVSIIKPDAISVSIVPSGVYGKKTIAT